jgi:hypothetical protein
MYELKCLDVGPKVACIVSTDCPYKQEGVKQLQAIAACQDKNGSELDDRVIMVREDREDRDIKRGRKQTGLAKTNGESSGLQVWGLRMDCCCLACDSEVCQRHCASQFQGLSVSEAVSNPCTLEDPCCWLYGSKWIHRCSLQKSKQAHVRCRAVEGQSSA